MMTEATLSKEQRILQAMRITLTGVIKDTATPHDMKHPLSDQTIEDLRQCMALINARERELSAEGNSPQNQRPRYADEPQPQKPVVVQFLKKVKKEPESG